MLSLGFGEIITWVYGALSLWGGYNLDICCYKIMERCTLSLGCVEVITCVDVVLMFWEGYNLCVCCFKVVWRL